MYTQLKTIGLRFQMDSYGVCDDCGEDIPFERLEAVPYTTCCIEHTDKNIAQNRPAEEHLFASIKR